MSYDNRKSISDIRSQDPLSEHSRKERRNLLLICLLGLIMKKAGLIPTKISTLGIEFTQTNQSTLLLLTGLLVTYYLISFIIYSFTDFVAWRLDYNKTFLHNVTNPNEFKHLPEDKELVKTLIDKLDYWANVSKIGSLLRGSIEFLFPIILGVYVSVQLFFL